MFFSPSATYSVVPPKIATVSAYGSPTPSARMRAGKSSAFTTALIDVYPETMIRPSIIRPKAGSAESACDTAVSSGTVHSVAPTPKAMRSGRRPIRSDSAPNAG